MDQPKYSSLFETLKTIPDPRKPRGKQLEWPFLLVIIAAALLAQHRSAAAIAQWTHEHAATLIATFRPARSRVPSEATLRRALHHVDVRALEQQLSKLELEDPPSVSAADPFEGVSVDGKHVRGAAAHGHPTVLVSLVEHATAEVQAQTAVASKRHESSAVGPLLAGRDLSGIVVTMDAGLTVRSIASQILEQGGHYLMVVKRNRRQLHDELSWFFSTPPLACEVPWHECKMRNKGHGRLETRTLTCTDDLDEYLLWPGVQQVLRRECERVDLKTGKVTRGVTYAITSLGHEQASAAELARLWRGHWTIENRRHYVRDVTMGEDGVQMHVGSAPRALAALRNVLITLVRRAGWQNVAAGLRHFGATPSRALEFIGVPAQGL